MNYWLMQFNVLYINENDNIMWNFMPLMSCFPSNFIDNLPEK
jgi:hypothetical protein